MRSAPRGHARRRLAVLALALFAAACSTDDILRPNVDVGQRTGAIEPVEITRLPPGDVTDAPALAGRTVSAYPAVEPGPDDELVSNAQSALYGEGTDEEAASAGESGDQSLVIPSPTQQAAQSKPPVRLAALPPVVRPLPPQDDGEAMMSRPEIPRQPRAMLDADEADCRRELKKLGVTYQDLPPIRDSAACYIDNPVRVSAMGSVEMKPAATLTCRMALTFARWTRNELVPNTRWRYFSGVKTIRQGSSYSCRKIAGSRTQSAHSTGNALDVMAIELNNGKDIDVVKKGLFSFRERKLLNNVRADGCEYFTTVLGPGYNYDHRNHFHFDLMQRKSGHRACH